jgi:hypothetical protein
MFFLINSANKGNHLRKSGQITPLLELVVDTISMLVHAHMKKALEVNFLVGSVHCDF